MTDQPPSSAAPIPATAPAPAFHASVIARLRAYFLAGILITAPIGITIYLAWQFIRYVDTTVTPLLPNRYNPDTYLPFSIPGLGVVIVVVGLTLIGFFTAGFVGRFLVRISESVLSRMPVVRGLYGAIKQIFETVFKSQSNAFQQVVLVEFPCPEAWSMGFISGNTEGEVGDNLPDDMVNVFVPMTPNITSGFLIFVPRRKLVPLSMSVEDGIKMVVSIGIVTPLDRRLERVAELARSQQAAQ